MIELEKTYLAKCLPEGLANCRHKEIIDIYHPKGAEHPVLRLRKNHDKYEMTKKQPVGEDRSVQEEQTIILSEEEWTALSLLEGKKVHKIRYYYDFDGGIAEFDVFQGPLQGLVVVDVEFSSEKATNDFKMPSFCLVDVSQEEFIAGGMVCGKSYSDIKSELDRLGYIKVFL